MFFPQHVLNETFVPQVLVSEVPWPKRVSLPQMCSGVLGGDLTLQTTHECQELFCGNKMNEIKQSVCVVFENAWYKHYIKINVNS